ncbi:MAG: 2'-5' RNA ligase family protein [Sphingomicrobium sp.]|nr:2'-5' RNA ligase family protein [Sphingomonadales bacterium]
MALTAPLIATADFAPADVAFFDAERRAHFPPERNILPAHLTLFYALPPSVEPELRRRLAQAVDRPAPCAMLAGLRSLGSGVAYVIASDELDDLRADLADAFAGCLTAQDAQGWRAHVTIQNKVEPRVARELLTDKERGFRPRPLHLAGLGLHRYRGGPWEPVQRWRFRGG